MILKRNPKRKHQVVLLLLQIPIESTFFYSLPQPLFPRRICCLLNISLCYLSYTFSIFISFINVVICNQSIHRSIHQSILSTLSFQTPTHTSC